MIQELSPFASTCMLRNRLKRCFGTEMYRIKRYEVEEFSFFFCTTVVFVKLIGIVSK